MCCSCLAKLLAAFMIACESTPHHDCDQQQQRARLKIEMEWNACAHGLHTTVLQNARGTCALSQTRACCASLKYPRRKRLTFLRCAGRCRLIRQGVLGHAGSCDPPSTAVPSHTHTPNKQEAGRNKACVCVCHACSITRSGSTGKARRPRKAP